ncbi:2-amino-4-hydroxy-6-hydroxymethyldihydropteridine diphosphokinase [bacterium]|nr:2-amino-4-hydroxy-6-hydroxymethyldihydropteridine diphosphokinase [bacterium]
MAIVYLCLGSNKGDRVGYVQQATSLLGAVDGIKVIRTSSFYETEPWLELSKNWFVNAVLEIKTSMLPDELLITCQRIETQLGRNREVEGRYGDRNIDIDILFYGGEIISEENLIVPHPRVHERAFTLVPMLEINPEFVHPVMKKTLAELHEELENPEMVYLYGTRLEPEKEEN